MARKPRRTLARCRGRLVSYAAHTPSLSPEAPTDAPDWDDIERRRRQKWVERQRKAGNRNARPEDAPPRKEDWIEPCRRCGSTDFLLNKRRVQKDGRTYEYLSRACAPCAVRRNRRWRRRT